MFFSFQTVFLSESFSLFWIFMHVKIWTLLFMFNILVFCAFCLPWRPWMEISQRQNVVRGIFSLVRSMSLLDIITINKCKVENCVQSTELGVCVCVCVGAGWTEVKFCPAWCGFSQSFVGFRLSRVIQPNRLSPDLLNLLICRTPLLCWRPIIMAGLVISGSQRPPDSIDMRRLSRSQLLNNRENIFLCREAHFGLVLEE